jgi:hypothetical protein
MKKKPVEVVELEAFQKAFIESEMVMRNNLAARIEVLLEREFDLHTRMKLREAIDIVSGVVKDDKK